MTDLLIGWGTVDESIAEYAYAIYRHRQEHGIDGDHLSDWHDGKIAYEEACESSRLELIKFIEADVCQYDRQFLNEILRMRREREKV